MEVTKAHRIRRRFDQVQLRTRDSVTSKHFYSIPEKAEATSFCPATAQESSVVEKIRRTIEVNMCSNLSENVEV